MTAVVVVVAVEQLVGRGRYRETRSFAKKTREKALSCVYSLASPCPASSQSICARRRRCNKEDRQGPVVVSLCVRACVGGYKGGCRCNG